MTPLNPITLYAGTGGGGVFKWIATANLPPTFTNLPASRTITAGTAFSFQVLASDPEGDPLTYSLSGAPAGMSISTTGLINWSSPVAGSYTITVRVSDGINPAVSSILRITVQTVLVFTIDKPTYTVNGVPQTMDVSPIIIEGRTMLPIRFVAEPLGATVLWDNVSRKVTVLLGTIKIELWIDNPVARVNGVNTPIDPANNKVVPKLVSGRTLLPLRFISENLGAEVIWDGSLRTATVRYPR